MPRFLTSRIAAFAGGVAALCFTAGCQTQPSSPSPALVPKQTFHGQLHYAGPAQSTIGETVIGLFTGGGFGLEFVSGPGFPLLKLQHDGSAVVAEGVFARGRWRGRAEAAPDHLKRWLLLREVFDRAQAAAPPAGMVKFASRGASAWTAEAEYSGGRLRKLRVAFPPTGERFAFRFAS